MQQTRLISGLAQIEVRVREREPTGARTVKILSRTPNITHDSSQRRPADGNLGRVQQPQYLSRLGEECGQRRRRSFPTVAYHDLCRTHDLEFGSIRATKRQ
jgi:hypothetical protein